MLLFCQALFLAVTQCSSGQSVVLGKIVIAYEQTLFDNIFGEKIF